MSAKNTHKFLVTGSTGLVGSRFIDLFKNILSITTVGRKDTDLRTDLTSEHKIAKIVESSDAGAIINFAAFTNVDEAEKEKGNINGEVYTLNALLPLWLIKACNNSSKKLFHISTDYVFDGQKDDRPYNEEDIPSPVNSWYSMTKYMGEENILNSASKANFVILRISYPYSGLYTKKLDIARAVVERLRNNEQYFGIEDQKIKPTSVDDIANALYSLIKNKSTGIYHVAGNYSPNEYITPYEFAQKVAKILNMDSSLIKPTSFLELSKKRLAPRPKHTWLDTKKIESLGFKITPIDEALKRFKNQLLDLM